MAPQLNPFEYSKPEVTLYDVNGRIEGDFVIAYGNHDPLNLELSGRCVTHIIRPGQYYKIIVHWPEAVDTIINSYVTPVMPNPHNNWRGYTDITRMDRFGKCPAHIFKFSMLRFREMTNAEIVVSGLLNLPEAPDAL